MRGWTGGLGALVLSAVLMGGAALAATTVRGSDDPEVGAVCRRLADRAPPAADRPDAATTHALKNCSSENLYYGIGIARDPVRARQCAFVEADGSDADDPFAGRSMLMTIYANGEGVRRDLDLATRYACESYWATAELEFRVRRLQSYKAKAWTGHDFGVCTDATSGHLEGFCAAHDASIADAARHGAAKRRSAGWSAAERAAFPALQAAFKRFVDLRSDAEVDQSGTGRNANTIAEEQAQDKAFDALVGAVDAGRLPVAGPAEARAADAALNVAYRRALGTPAKGEAGTITADGVRRTQRAWVAYRDAWLAFARRVRPDLSADALLTSLTRARVTALSELAQN